MHRGVVERNDGPSFRNVRQIAEEQHMTSVDTREAHIALVITNSRPNTVAATCLCTLKTRTEIVEHGTLSADWAN